MDFVEILQHHLLDHRILHLFTIGHTSFDFTIDVLMMWIAGLILLAVLMLARAQSGKVSHGWANLFEIFIVYVRDEIVRPNLGDAGDTYLPYFLTLFFFILICNL